MASQEFLASFAVEIDESGVSRLQRILDGNRELADQAAAAFDAAASSIRTFAEELGVLPGFSSRDITAEGLTGSGGLAAGLDLTQAKKELDAFIREAKKPIPLYGNGSGLTSAGRSAYNSIRSIFSAPVTIRAKTAKDEAGGGAGDGRDTPLPMSAGGRFAKPTEVQVAEDGDAEYIIPVRKEDRAVPLLRQLLAELSPSARGSLAGSAGGVTFSGGLSAGTASIGNITQDNRTVSAPVSIQVQSSGANAEQIGQRLYNTAERYLLRTLKGAFG